MHKGNIKTLILIFLVFIITGCHSTNTDINNEETKSDVNYEDEMIQAVDYLNNGQYELAEKKLKELIAKDSNNEQYDFILGEVYRVQKKYEQALENYNRALKKNPKFKEAYNNIAGIAILAEEYDKAMEVVDKGLVIDPEFSELNFKKGQLLYVKKEYEKSIPYLQKVIDNPQYADAYRFLGFCYYRTDNKQEAAKYFKLFLDKTPETNPFRDNINQLVKQLEK